MVEPSESCIECESDECSIYLVMMDRRGYFRICSRCELERRAALAAERRAEALAADVQHAKQLEASRTKRRRSG